MVDETKMTESERMLAELLLRVSTVEKLLIDKNLITAEEYNDVFTKSVAKLTDALKMEQNKSTEIIPPGVLKN